MRDRIHFDVNIFFLSCFKEKKNKNKTAFLSAVLLSGLLVGLTPARLFLEWLYQSLPLSSEVLIASSLSTL